MPPGAICSDVKVPAGNQFGGGLAGSLPDETVSGGAVGSFVKNGSNAVGGVIGNWAIGTANDSQLSYKATGIFGGAVVPTPSVVVAVP